MIKGNSKPVDENDLMLRGLAHTELEVIDYNAGTERQKADELKAAPSAENGARQDALGNACESECHACVGCNTNVTTKFQHLYRRAKKQGGAA